MELLAWNTGEKCQKYYQLLFNVSIQTSIQTYRNTSTLTKILLPLKIRNFYIYTFSINIWKYIFVIRNFFWDWKTIWKQIHISYSSHQILFIKLHLYYHSKEKRTKFLLNYLLPISFLQRILNISFTTLKDLYSEI